VKKEEKTVFEYLKSEGYKLIKFEPDGNIPPDFMIDDSTAVEVRRLNENYFSGDKPVGHYEEHHGLWELLFHFLAGYKNVNMKSSYWLDFGYERPIPEPNELKKNLKLQLDNFIQNPVPYAELKVTPSFTIRLIPKQTEEKNAILLASSHDDNGGGAVLQIYIANINYCIREKTSKIRRAKINYSQWWIILVDSLIYGINSIEMEQLKKYIVLPVQWKKLIILDPETKKAILILSN
jgi:hypothetical protein